MLWMNSNILIKPEKQNHFFNIYEVIPLIQIYVT